MSYSWPLLHAFFAKKCCKIIMLDSRREFIHKMSYFIIGFAIFYYFLDAGEKLKNGKTSKFSYGNIPNDSNIRKFWNKLYLSITTTTTLGFGDITPIHPVSQIAVAIQSLTIFFLVTELVQ